MLFRSILAAALLSAAPVLAQDAQPDLREQVAAYVRPSNAERLRVLTEQLTAAGFDYQVETFEGGREGHPMQGSNVVVVIGDGATVGGREILLTAHYDAVVLRDGSFSHGVVDNAASVVGLIETAKMLRQRNLAHRVRILFTDQEELGLIGAREWVEAHGLANVVAVVNSDVAGYGDTLMHGLNNGPQSAFVTRAVLEVCAERLMNCIGFPEYGASDDLVFSAAGTPVVSLGFQDAGGAHQMWLALNGGDMNGLAPGFVPPVFRNIHSHEDTMERLDPDTVRTASEVYADVVERLDRTLRN